VVSDVKAHPSVILLALGNSEHLSQVVRLSSDISREFTVNDVATDPNMPITVSCVGGRNGEKWFKIDVTRSVDKPFHANLIEGFIVFYLNDGNFVSVPVMVFAKEQ
jgi:hypothetical protein